MAFDLDDLERAVAKHGRVARVVIANVQGSSPREVGAAMLVWQGGQSGTIGGGALEFELAKSALNVQGSRLSQHSLGPDLGQCCGGAVQVVTEVFHARNLPRPDNNVLARAVSDATSTPLRAQKILANARARGELPKAQLCEGWFIEPIHKPSRALWIWGAGHVGRAIVQTLSPLPDFDITWVDTDTRRFPENTPDGVNILPAAQPARLVSHAPKSAEHLILTYSHALDLELCHQLLNHGFTFAGLIGSKSKWARFRNRLIGLGQTNDQIARITCPIGNPSLGKHPQTIAIGVAGSLLDATTSHTQIQRSATA